MVVSRVDAGYNQYDSPQHRSTLAAVQAVYRKIGANIRAVRTAKGWTQDVLADKSGLHRAHIGEIERGETNMTIQTLKILADALSVTLTDLVRHT